MHGSGRHRLGDAGPQGDDAGDVRRLGGLGDAADDDIVDECWIETGASEERNDGEAAEYVMTEHRLRPFGRGEALLANSQ